MWFQNRRTKYKRCKAEEEEAESREGINKGKNQCDNLRRNVMHKSSGGST